MVSNEPVTHALYVLGAVFPSGVHWDILILVKVDSSVAGAKQLPGKHTHVSVINQIGNHHFTTVDHMML